MSITVDLSRCRSDGFRGYLEKHRPGQSGFELRDDVGAPYVVKGSEGGDDSVQRVASPMIGSRTSFALMAVVLVFVSACAVVLASPGKGEVGGPPTIALGPPDEGTKTSRVLVIGVGSVLHWTVELGAYAWKPSADHAGKVTSVFRLSNP